MRKFLVFFLACLIVLSAAITAYAAGSVSVSVSASSKTAMAGDKVTITVSATVDTCESGGVEISFDKDVFELDSAEWLLSGTFMKDFDIKSLDGVFAFESAKKVSGKVFKFVLKVKNGAVLNQESVTVKFTADKKTASKSVTISCGHKYSNNCDTTCNSCGETRKITHTWDAGKAITAATCQKEGSAKFTCKVCGETKTESVKKAAHSYDNNCDTSCNVCGASRKTEHSYQWKCSAQNHWQECVSCGAQQDAQAHTMDTKFTSDNKGHGYACKVCGLIPASEPHVFDSSCDGDCAECGYERNVQHAYRERYAYDEEGHWHECMLCGDVLEKRPHTPTQAATEDTDQICSTCGYILEAAGNHVHTMGGDWLSDEFSHWYVCRCGELIEPMEHIWGEGSLDETTGIITFRCEDCGQFKAELSVIEKEEQEQDVYLPQVIEEQEKMMFGYPLWMVIAVALAVSALINLILIIRLAVLVAKIKRGDIY